MNELELLLLEAAETCEAWAKDSREGGWSTHQVAANLALAAKLRRAACVSFNSRRGSASTDPSRLTA